MGRGGICHVRKVGKSRRQKGLNGKFYKEKMIVPKNLIETIRKVLLKDQRILFAYLYGSAVSRRVVQDIDIAVYASDDQNPHVLPVELKIALYQATGLSADTFDIRVINGIVENGDLFGLLYLKNIFSESRLIVDRNPDVRTDLIDHYGSKYRECQGLIGEVLS